MRTHTLSLTDDELKAVSEGLGLLIERRRADPRSFEPEEIAAALDALEKAADAEFQAAHPELRDPPGMG